MNTEGAKENIGEKPGYIFELGADLGSSRTFSIRGNFAVGTSLEVMNAELDKLVRACDRQLSKAVISTLEEDLFKHEHMLKKAERDYVSAGERTKGHKSLPAVEQANQENQKANIAELKTIVERKKAFLNKTREEAK